jgi:hypothetical protein
VAEIFAPGPHCFTPIGRMTARIGRLSARIRRIATIGLDARTAGPKEQALSRTDLGAAAGKARTLRVWMKRSGAPVQGPRRRSQRDL